jgi:hypothetical protein
MTDLQINGQNIPLHLQYLWATKLRWYQLHMTSVNFPKTVGFEILSVVVMKSTIFWI